MYGMRLEEARAYVGGRGDKGRSVKTELAETAALEHQCCVRASEKKDGRGEDGKARGERDLSTQTRTSLFPTSDNVDSIGYRSKAFTNDQMVVTVQSRPLEIATSGGGLGRAMRVHRRSFSSFECLGVALNRNDAFKVARGVDVVPEVILRDLSPFCARRAKRVPRVSESRVR
ncbi:hypothetical protein R3P38DRAFT_3365490 [Favolaschia claudopus]|uniref:Uncharacterized protein n=1 Tax=Favolaschia claudopus TaxID=2862362 RepID=A0AAW0AGP1_9AGAR